MVLDRWERTSNGPIRPTQRGSNPLHWRAAGAVDIDPNAFTMNPAAIEAAITTSDWQSVILLAKGGDDRSCWTTLRLHLLCRRADSRSLSWNRHCHM